MSKRIRYSHEKSTVLGVHCALCNGKLSIMAAPYFHQELFKQLGTEWVLSDMLFQSLQEFTCKLYCSQPGTDNTNALRYRLFCAKKGNIDSTLLYLVLTACSSMRLAQTSKQPFGSEVCKAAKGHRSPLVLAGAKTVITLPLTG